MILKKKSVFLLILFCSIIIIPYLFYDIKNKVIVYEDTYYLLKKNTNQKTILSELKTKNIDISRLEWQLISFIHEKPFIPKAGEYLIPKNFTLYNLQKILQVGKTLTRNFTLIEGSTAEELEINLLKNPYLTGEVKNLKEGIYKPDTYFFKYGYPRVKLLAKMKIAQDNLLDIIWKEKPKDFILKNKNELLILASIIQKESNDIEDSKLVASVFINRLKNKIKLQSDVTLAYGFRVDGEKITKKMLKSNNLFNTYYFKGLPPAPISYPGKNALNSLRDIKKTNYLYFVSDGNGKHRFAETYSLHKKNIELWKKKISKDK